VTSDKSSQLCDIIIFDCISLQRTPHDDTSLHIAKESSVRHV